MAVYHVNPSATGLNNGTTPANAWVTAQAAVDGLNGTPPTAGDTVLMYGLEVVTATTVWDGLSGTALLNIQWVGVNSSWVEDGTKYILDADGAAIDIITVSAGVDFNLFRNIRITGTTGISNDGMSFLGYASAEGWVFDNVDFSDNGGSGLRSVSSSLHDTIIINSKFLNNGDTGSNASATYINCSATGNGVRGIGSASGGTDDMLLLNCLVHSNGSGVESGSWDRGLQVINSVIANNTGPGITSPLNNSLVYGSRITGNTVGASLVSSSVYIGYSYMPGVGQDEANTVNTTGPGILYDLSNKAGVTSNILAGTDVSGGYENVAADNYNLSDTASLSNLIIDLET